MIQSNKKWIHLIAIGGTGMGALAVQLQTLGYWVTGSDGPLYPPMSTFLDSSNIARVEGYSAKNLKGENWKIPALAQYPQIIVIGNAISRNNEEAQFAETLVSQGHSKKMSFAEALAEYCIQDKESFVVAGTHGKTTTTSILAWCMNASGLNPGFFIGGIPKNFAQGLMTPAQSQIFVSEGDEYDTAYWDKESKFLHYRPSWVLCTGVEFDHADIYSNIEAIEESFIKLIAKTKKAWILIDPFTSPRPASIERLESVLKQKKVPFKTYGRKGDYRLLQLRAEKIIRDSVEYVGSRLEIEDPEWGRVSFLSPMIGEHNALNVLGVFATLRESGKLKTSIQDFEKTLLSFEGVKRRQEELCRSSSWLVIDDFAHHPTAIRETISAIKQRYPDRKVFAYFEPRSATSARNVLFQAFCECFDGADAIFLMPPTKTNVPESEKLQIDKLSENLSQRKALMGKTIFISSSVDDLETASKKEWETKGRKPALALLMSNGSFGGLHKRLCQWI